ncbi:MAG: TSUP family transporter [Christensenellales bacterium]|jgi:uncharacterized membrane protein YfcA
MKYFFLVLAGAVGGLIGGMGMGGGTLLIPILTIFLDVEQHTAQWINLLAFVPMAVIALIIHCKNKLVIYKEILPLLLPAVATTILASFLAVSSPPRILKLMFGIFLILMAVFSLVMTAIEIIRKKREEKRAEKHD